MNEIFIPSSQKIVEIFGGDRCYQVPDYQRPYSWESEQIEQLWEDIFTAFENEDLEYFLGSIILTRNKRNKYLDIIDGQQRLTTLIILFCTLRDLYYDNTTDTKKRNRILGRIRNIENDEERLKFRTQVQKQNKFEQEILISINFDKKQSSRKENHFFNAACIFKDKIESLKAKNPELIEPFTEYLLEKVRVITIECTERSFAIKLFQVLNNRGMELTPADLIKSYLMGRLGDNEQDFATFNADWIEIENKAKELEEDLTKFFTYYEYYLLARNPKKGIYDELERQFKHRNPKEIIFEFKKLIKYYEDIFNTESKDIYSLFYLKHGDYWKSILIASKLMNWNKSDLNKLIKTLKRFYYLYWIADYITPKIKQTSFNILSWIKNGKDIDFIKHELNKKMSEDKVILRALRSLTSNDVYYASWWKPLLVLIEYQQTDESNINFITLDKTIHIEHILPRAYHKIVYWSERFSKATADELVNTIGNLVLLSGKKNIAASNNPFPDKIEIYSGKGIDGITGFRTTQRIFDKTKEDKEWTKETIDNRKNWILHEIGKLLEIDVNQEIPDEADELEEIVPSINVEEAYEKLKEKILALGDDIKIEPKKKYIAFKRVGNFVCMHKQHTQLKVWLNIPEGTLDDPKQITRDVSTIGHWGTGNYEIILTNLEEIDYVFSLIRQAYEANLTLILESKYEPIFDDNYVMTQTNPEIYKLLQEFRRQLRQITEYEEKINKYFMGFRNGENYFAIINPRKNSLLFKIPDINTTNLKIIEKEDKKYVKFGEEEIFYDEENNKLKFNLYNLDDVKKALGLVNLSNKYDKSKEKQND